jgi:Flp pilus assembly protein TadD
MPTASFLPIRPGWSFGLALALLAPVLAAGCRTTASQARPPLTDPQSPGVGTTLGIRTDQAVDKTVFQSAASPEQEANVHVALGRALETKGHYDAAIAEYQKAIDAADRPGRRHAGPKVSSQEQALAHRRMAAALDRLGRFAQAEVHYRAALRLDPKDAKIWNDAGYSYYLQGRWPDAERALKTAAKLDPNNSRIQTNLGLTLAAAGKADAALAALTRAGGSAVAHANLGYILAASGKRAEARQHYLKALQLQPNLAAVRAALAKLDADTANASANAAQVADLPISPTATPMDSDLSRASSFARPPVRR